MRLRTPLPTEAQFATIIIDIDSDEPQVQFHKDEQTAKAYLDEQYQDVPDISEPGGQHYDEGEDPNADLSVVRVILARVLRRTLL